MTMMMMEDEGQGSAVGSYCDGLFFGAFTFASLCLTDVILEHYGQ